MTIQWFPGHMTKAKREVEEKIKFIDIVIELVDARIPVSSRNPLIDEILNNKPRIVLLNKNDLADPNLTQHWVKYFQVNLNLQAIPINSLEGNPLKVIYPHLKRLFNEKIIRLQKKNIQSKEMRILIIGIPNVGKSTLINKLVGKKITKTGDQPGVTKGLQWIKINDDVTLLDTPGILWPKFEDQQVGMKLAVTGAIKNDVLPIFEVTDFALNYLMRYYSNVLIDKLEFSCQFDNKIENYTYNFLCKFGGKRGILKSGGEIDIEKTAFLFLRELRSGKLGRFSLDNLDN